MEELSLVKKLLCFIQTDKSKIYFHIIFCICPIRTLKKDNALILKVIETGNKTKLIKTCISKYSSAPVMAGNTFQDTPRLRENADITEPYIYRHNRVTYINTVKFNL
jgi:hypothetical protein